MKTFIDELDFLKKTVTIQWNIRRKKDLLLLPIKSEEKIHYATNILSILFEEKKNTKLVKWWKIIAQQPKAFENANIVNIKSVTIEHPKTSCKLSKTIKQAEKISQVSVAGKNSDSPLYSETEKKNFFGWNDLMLTIVM